MRATQSKPLFFLALLLPLCSSQSADDCPGYTASNVQYGTGEVTADLKLAGEPCNAYGTDLRDLRLLVEYQTSTYPYSPGAVAC